MSERSRAGCRFFQRLAHRLGADRLNEAQDDDLVRQQLQCPVAPPARRVSACQLHELLLDVSFDLDLLRPCRLRSVIDGLVDPFHDKSLPDAGDRVHAGAESGDDLIIAMPLPAGRIGQQEDTCVGQFSTRRLTGGDQLFQSDAFIDFQGDTELLHHGAPSIAEHPSRDVPRDHEAVLSVNRRRPCPSPPSTKSPSFHKLLQNPKTYPPIED